MSLIKQLAERCAPLLNQPMILKTRRNHSLEHATIHILSRQRIALSGRSSDSGFILLGEAATEQVEQAVDEALRRLQAGERELALHPNCGTNLVTAGFLGASAAFVAFAGRGWRRAWARFPSVMILVMAAVLLSTPLGMSLQKHFTTDSDLGDMRVLSVSRSTLSLPLAGRQLTLHRVMTAQA